MLPPEGLITLIGALFIGLVSGIVSARSKSQALAFGAYFAAFMLAIVLGAVIEAHAAGKNIFYSFGSHLLHHLAVAILSVTAVHLAVVGVAHLKASNSGQTSAYIPHALGLLNLYGGLGCVAQLIYWGVNRNNSVASDEAREALQFQAMYLAVLLFFGFLVKVFAFISPVIPLLFFFPWLILTVIAIVQAKRKGTYSYPLNVRFLRRSQQANQVV